MLLDGDEPVVRLHHLNKISLIYLARELPRIWVVLAKQLRLPSILVWETELHAFRPRLLPSFLRLVQPLLLPPNGLHPDMLGSDTMLRKVIGAQRVLGRVVRAHGIQLRSLIRQRIKILHDMLPMMRSVPAQLAHHFVPRAGTAQCTLILLQLKEWLALLRALLRLLLNFWQLNKIGRVLRVRVGAGVRPQLQSIRVR